MANYVEPMQPIFTFTAEMTPTSDTAPVKVFVPSYNKGYPLIGKSIKNLLYGADSRHSTGQKLPSVYSTNMGLFKGSLDTASKDELLDYLRKLMLAGNSRAMLRYMKNGYEVSRDMGIVSVAMADFFATNTSYSLNNTFSHPALTNAIAESDAFVKYKQDTYESLKKTLQSVPPSDIAQIQVTNNLIIFYMNGLADMVNGLTITINQVSFVEVYADKVQTSPDKKRLTGATLRYVIYDTFGLDNEDIDKYGLLNPTSEGWAKFYKRSALQKSISTTLGTQFNAWWLLQYKYGCVPFIVKAEIKDVEIKL